MAKNVFRFRRLKWGDPERPWLKRGGREPPQQTGRSWLDSPWMIVGGFVLAFGMGWWLFGA